MTPVLQVRYCVDIFFHILVRQEYWVLTEKPVIGDLRIDTLSICSHEQT